MSRSTVAVVSAAALTLATLSAGAAPAQATPAPARHAAKWLVTQQSKGRVITHSSYGKFVDYGLSIDLGLALKSIGVHHKVVVKVRRALAHNIRAYTGSGSEVYSGASAKALYFAQHSGATGRHFGGVNLVKRLNHRVSTTKGIRGRLSDKSAYGDYANTIGQAYAAAALSRAGSPKAAPVTKFLLRQQCKSGFFRLNFAKVKARKQSCNAGGRSLSAPDTDVTALGVITLETVRKPGKRIRRAIARAGRWLARHQKRNGSFRGGRTTGASNTNSTGLSARALALTGHCKKARHAARWVHKLERRNGSIAYDKAALAAAKKDGITRATRDQWRRATAQAGPALVYVNGCR